MARIRTIKPSFFKSYKLYCAEIETGFPLRVAFSGLWTVADREGRFQWIPQELKVDCLPHDELDFSRVLDALWTRGYIDKYEVDGHQYGVIPTFSDHQVINNRESPSDLPEPNENNALTRASPVTHAKRTRLKHAQAEGKGREGKGKEESKSRATALPPDFVLTPERETYAVSKGADPKAEIEAFRAHHTAHGKTMRDWDAAWRTWCINARKFAGKNPPPGKSTAAMHEDADDRQRREAYATARADQRRWKLRPQMLGEDEDSFVSRISREAGDAQLKTFQKPGSAA